MVIALMALMMKDKMTGRKLDEKDRLYKQRVRQLKYEQKIYLLKLLIEFFFINSKQHGNRNYVAPRNII